MTKVIKGQTRAIRKTGAKDTFMFWRAGSCPESRQKAFGLPFLFLFRATDLSRSTTGSRRLFASTRFDAGCRWE